MKSDWELLSQLAVAIDLEHDEEDIAAAAFDGLGFPYPSEQYAPDLVRKLVLELERRREAGLLVREWIEDGPGLLYYEPAAADADEDARARGIEASGPGHRRKHQRQLRRAVALRCSSARAQRLFGTLAHVAVVVSASRRRSLGAGSTGAVSIRSSA